MFQEKVVFKNFAIQYSQENTCVGITFLIKMQVLRSAVLFKIDCNTGAFLRILWNVCLKTPILKNISERLLLKLFLERFPTWANKMEVKKTIFQEQNKQTKKSSKAQLYEKRLLFLFCFSLFLLCTSFSLHNKRW